jgi:outer membrane protein assembly factor BamB
MHPDYSELAAYLDGALDPAAQAQLRAHVLTCPACAARLERLRADARTIAATMASARPTPDVRARVRARLRQPAWGAWLARGVALASTAAALLLFALLLATGSRATGLRSPDRLYVTDRRAGQLIVLDSSNGTLLDSSRLGDQPGSIAYDSRQGRLYVVLKRSVVALDPRSLQPLARWIAPRPLDTSASLALDSRRGRLYLIAGDALIGLDLVAPELGVAATYQLGAQPSSLALAPDGSVLYALDPQAGRLWSVELASGSATSLDLTAATSGRSGWLAMSSDGRSLYALLTLAFNGSQPGIWRIDTHGRTWQSAPLAASQPPWDLEALDERLAIPRGNGATGGVEIVGTAALSRTALLDPEHDQHHLVVGAGGELFGLNFTHNAVTRYDANTGTVAWRTPEGGGYQPWDGVLVPGGSRWPWEQ